MKCPICKGRGELENPKKSETERRQEATMVLLEKGYGIREVQRLVGYKSPNSVFKIKNYNKCKEINCKTFISKNSPKFCPKHNEKNI